MPLYDYECLSCGHPFELRQSFSEAGVGTCPQCSGGARRKFHAVPVIYKGSGFYTTDYSRPKPPPDTKESKESKESKDGGKAASKKDAEPKAESKSTAKDKSASEVAV